jgi:hypothetical protein
MSYAISKGGAFHSVDTVADEDDCGPVGDPQYLYSGARSVVIGEFVLPPRL